MDEGNFMKCFKGLSAGFFAAIILVVVSSCGVPSPTVPTAIAEPTDASTIGSSSSIIIKFSTSMTTGSLSLSGDMAGESNGGAWSRTSQTNDTLTLSPSVANRGVWTAGEHTLIIDIEASSGKPLATLTLNYRILAPVPVVIAVSPEVDSTIVGLTPLIIIFNVSMDPSTLLLSGDMAAESDGGTWSKSLTDNDTLIIRPNFFWTGVTHTLIMNVDSAEGVSLPTLVLISTVDTDIPSALELPANNAAINTSTSIVISFNVEMIPGSLALSGTLVPESNSRIWSSVSNTNDTLTITPTTSWSAGAQTLIVDVLASNVIALPTLTLNYTVDASLPTASVTPASDSLITGGESIVISFTESMDTATLALSGRLSAVADGGESDGGVWSNSSVDDDTLTISPAASWAAGTAGITTLDIDDLVGNSVATLNLAYEVDVITPAGTPTPLSGSVLYSSDDDIVINFTESMAPGTLGYTGSLSVEVGASNWSTNTNTDDTLTIVASTVWSIDAQVINVTVEDVAGNPMVLILAYSVAADMCSDGEMNQDETDTDCGGAICSACTDGASCGKNADCNSNLCDTGICLVDADNDTFSFGVDCDDSNANVYPGADELCNGIDDDCVGGTDENLDYVDSCTAFTCEGASGFTASEVADGSFCDDGDPNTVNDICTTGICAGSPCPDTDSDGICDFEDPCPLDNPDDVNGNGICDSDEV